MHGSFASFFIPAALLLTVTYQTDETDGLKGSAWGGWANYTASPLRAFASEWALLGGGHCF